MDALEFAKELRRMCESHPNGCSQCDLYVEDTQYCSIINLEKAVPIVEKWSKEHPIVRNVDHVAELLEKAGYEVEKDVIANNRCPVPKSTFFSRRNNSQECNISYCETCRKWWLEPYKGERE